VLGPLKVKTSPARKAIGLLIAILMGILLNWFVTGHVQVDRCEESGGVWNKAAGKCEK
jgi:hypothetical protein